MERRGTKLDLDLLEDETLVIHVRQGSEDAARILYQRYWPDAFQRAQRADADAREALAHAIYACVVRVGFDLSRGKKLRPYLMKAVDNHLRDRYRSSWWRRVLSLEDPELARKVEARFLENDVDANAGEGRCAAAVQALLADWESGRAGRGNRRLWAAVLRRTCEGETPRDIAAALNVQPAAVSRLLSKRIRPAILAEMARLSTSEQPNDPADC